MMDLALRACDRHYPSWQVTIKCCGPFLSGIGPSLPPEAYPHRGPAGAHRVLQTLAAGLVCGFLAVVLSLSLGNLLFRPASRSRLRRNSVSRREGETGKARPPGPSGNPASGIGRAILAMGPLTLVVLSRDDEPRPTPFKSGDEINNLSLRCFQRDDGSLIPAAARMVTA
jgi:hypothetical protein